MRRPGPAHHARPGRGVPRAPAARAASSRRWPRSTPSTPPAIPPYRRYYEPDRLAVPSWAGDRDVWERAIALAHAPPPELPERFIHRDFHPGNTLWEGAELTGVVDWTTGSRGPAAVDLGHLRWNLALDYGQRVADAVLPTPSTIRTTTS